MKRIREIGFGAVVALGLFLFLVGFALRSRAGGAISEPSNPAMTNPDKHAWDLFLQLNRPADLSKGRGVPDAAKKIGDDGCTVWETWRLGRGEVYKDDGSQPPVWDDGANTACQGKALEPTNLLILTDAINQKRKVPHKFQLLIDTQELTNESRMNRATYEFIVTHELYNIEGQQVFVKEASRTYDKQTRTGSVLSFPEESMEIKGAWKELTKEEISQGAAKKYHTATVDGKTYGLTSLHIITKEVPNWFWATFAHKDNRSPAIPDRDTYGMPKELKGTKWENYKLSGTQVDFTSSVGQPTRLADTVIEDGFEETSSCMSCHAMASFGPNPGAKREDSLLGKTCSPLPNPSGREKVKCVVGSPDSSLFGDDKGLKYAQSDFVWSMPFRAKHKAVVSKPQPSQP
jgi:hypothetical protein